MKAIRIADHFCGAGGTSTGAIEAIELLGCEAHLTAINHWPVAIATHTANHPKARPVTEPLPTVTCNDRFALIQAKGGDVLFRMFRTHELAAAQGFRRDYRFEGNAREVTKQIGNAVPRNLARSLVLAALSQEPDIGRFLEVEEGRCVA